ncbi:hypothetical protein BDN70DRAFT_919709 [Pholiota conissans]|uniref:HNH nuclease domain-containing protein n=1 Tax=Pholiota conissans TaxID=109636 RepID=A0A9P5Z7X9_9AGAR|nr:hypothetical protein BDN70DRAFT_919709 [Pholiota conissans]
MPFDHPTSYRYYETCAILSCSPTEFNTLFEDEGKISTDTLSDDVKQSAIAQNRGYLRREQPDHYHLDEFLRAMLDHAPHPLGKRYVAVALYIAQKKGAEAVVTLANAWMEHLFLPMWVISAAYKSSFYDGSYPFYPHGSASTDFVVLEELKCKEEALNRQISTREQRRCCLTRAFDMERAIDLRQQHREDEIPGDGIGLPLALTPIIPFLLDSDEMGPTICGVTIKDSRCTRSLIRSWTQANIEDEVGSTWDIHTARNAIYLTLNLSLFFRIFHIYLDKEAYPETPNKYKMRAMRPFSLDPRLSGDVTFRTHEESGIEPPSAVLLGIHAALARVIESCSLTAMVYMESLEEKAVLYQQILDDILASEIKIKSGAAVDDGIKPVIL